MNSIRSGTGSPARFFDRPPVDYTAEVRFQQGWPIFNDGGLSPDMIGIPESEINEAESEIADAETEQPEEAGSEIAGEKQSDGDGTEIADAVGQEQNLQR